MSEGLGRPPGRRFAVVGGVLLLLVALFVLLGRLAGNPGEAGLLAMPGLRTRGPARLERSPAPAGPGVAVPEPEVVEALSLEEFMDVLQRRAPPDVVQSAADEFSASPAVVGAWRRYVGKRGKRSDARDLLGEVTRVPEFQRAIAKLAADPKSKAAFADLLEDPRIDATLRGDLDGPATDSVDPVLIAREWERMARSGALAGDSTLLSAGAEASAPRDPLKRRDGPAPASDGAGGENPPGGGSGRPGRLEPKPGEHDALKLERAWKDRSVAKEAVDKSEHWSGNEWLKLMLQHLGQDAATEISRRLQSSGPDQELDVWGSCWASGRYPQCVSVCSSVPEARCSGLIKDPWQACRAGDPPSRPSADCIVACLNNRPGYGCTQGQIDGSEWDAACRRQRVARGYCLPSQRWGSGQVCTGSGRSRVCRPMMGTRGSRTAGGSPAPPPSTSGGGGVRLCRVPDYENWTRDTSGRFGCGTLSDAACVGYLKRGIECRIYAAGPIVPAGSSLRGCFTSGRCGVGPTR